MEAIAYSEAFKFCSKAGGADMNSKLVKCTVKRCWKVIKSSLSVTDSVLTQLKVAFPQCISTWYGKLSQLQLKE